MMSEPQRLNDRRHVDRFHRQGGQLMARTQTAKRWDAKNDVHPVFSQEYGLFTPPIDEFFDTVCGWIENHVTGGYIYGTPRLGKSRAVKFWIVRLIEEKFGDALPFFRMLYKRHNYASEARFFTEVLTSVGHHYTKVRDVDAALKRVVNFFCSRACNRGSNHVVLMIDEAQNMRDAEFGWLCNIQNEMDEKGYRLTIISVGSHELAYQHEVFTLGGDAHLMGRFMVRHARFHGIRSLDELAYVLNGYDEQTEWPEGSGYSYTKYFFERAFNAGLRIKNTAEDLWKIYVELAPPNSRRFLEVPMEHIAKAIEYLFRTYGGPIADHRFVFEPAMLRTAIEQTGYRAHMRTISHISKQKNQ